MELDHPIVAYIAENNVEASQVAHMLCLNEIEAHAEEDDSVCRFMGIRPIAPSP